MISSNHHLKNERGIVGLVLLAAVLVGTIVAAGYYVYQVRTGQSDPITNGRSATPAEIKADADAAAADAAGRSAEIERLDDIGVGDEF